MNKWLIYGLVFVAGAMASSQVLSLPVLNKLPRF